MTTDLPCIGCGYNLRTLPDDGRCPECNRPVRSSLAEPIWRGSSRELRWTRFGVGLWLIAAIVPTATYILLDVWLLTLARFWDALRIPNSAPAIANRCITHVWVVSHETGALILGSAILALLWPRETTTTDRRRGLRKAVAAIAALGGLGVGGGAAVSYANQFAAVPTFVFVGSTCSAIALALASVFAWVSLIRRLGKAGRLVAVLLSCTLVVQLLNMLLLVLTGFINAVGIPVCGWVPFISEWCDTQPQLSLLIGRLTTHVLDRRAESIIQLTAALALWAYIRVLNRAQRVSNEHA